MLFYKSPYTAAELGVEARRALADSMVGPLMSKLKLCVDNAMKNKDLAASSQFRGLVFDLAEQILPQFLNQNADSGEKVSAVHDCCFLLAEKAQGAFQTGVIHTCID